jgi:hypothetical protein
MARTLKISTAGKILLIPVQLLLGLFSTLCLLSGMNFILKAAEKTSEEMFGIVFAEAVFLALAVYCFRRIYMNIQAVRLASRYRVALGQAPDLRIETLTAGLGTSEAELQKDIDTLAANGILAGAYIDKKQKALLLPSSVLEASDDAAADLNSADSGPVLFNVRCPGCGFVNSVERGARTFCEQCGKPLDSAKFF